MGAALTRVAVGAAIVLAVAVGLFALPQEGRADHMPCHAPNRGFDFDTLEPENYVATYGAAIELATAGKAVSFSYTPVAGETIDVRYQGLKSGPRGSRQPESTALAIPPTIYKSIAWIEANWANAAASVPYGGVGPTLVSGDCGYGIGQITSGMGHLSAPPAREVGVPSAVQAIIGTDPLFNIAQGVRILAEKWNSAPLVRPIAGNGDPSALEDWYYAIWSYNGFAFSNHPLNPDRDPLRGAGTSFIYHCYDPSAPSYQDTGSGPKFQYGDYTYPERVYGCMRFPPKLKSGATATAFDATGDPKFIPGDVVTVVGGGCINLRPTPSTSQKELACIPSGSKVTILGGPQSGTGYVWWNVHTDRGDGWMAEQFLSKPGPIPTGPPSGTPPVVDPVGRMWLPQVFNMPDFSNPAVAGAFSPENFNFCDGVGWVGGCPLMDFPTSFPQANPPVTTHRDSTPPTDPSWSGRLLGDPKLQISGPSAASLILNPDRTATSVTVTVKNLGTWLGPFRIRTSANWLVARHPGDSAARRLSASIAVGKETTIVTGAGTNKKTQAGYDSVLTITLDPALLPPGSSTGTVWIEPLLGSGATYQLSVQATNLDGSPGGGQGYRAVVPNLATGP